MKYLQLTKSTDPKNPADGYPYVFYNEDIDKVWIFFGLKWILSAGRWIMEKSWDDSGIWNYYTTEINSFEA